MSISSLYVHIYFWFIFNVTERITKLSVAFQEMLSFVTLCHLCALIIAYSRARFQPKDGWSGFLSGFKEFDLPLEALQGWLLKVAERREALSVPSALTREHLSDW